MPTKITAKAPPDADPQGFTFGTYGPCGEGRKFLAKCKTLRQAWEECPDPYWLAWAIHTSGLINPDADRAFKRWCRAQGVRTGRWDRVDDLVDCVWQFTESVVDDVWATAESDCGIRRPWVNWSEKRDDARAAAWAAISPEVCAAIRRAYAGKVFARAPKSR